MGSADCVVFGGELSYRDGRKKNNRTYGIIYKRAMRCNNGVECEADTFDIGVKSLRELDALCLLDRVDHLIKIDHVRG